MKANRLYKIDLEGEDTGAGTLRDPTIEGVYDAAGRFIAGTHDEDSGTGQNAQLYMWVLADTTNYVAVAGMSFGRYTYRLSVADVTGSNQYAADAGDDRDADITTDGEVSVGGSVEGNIENAADRDWFVVTLQDDVLYQIDVEGAQIDVEDAGTSQNGNGQGGSSTLTLEDPMLVGLHQSRFRIAPLTNDDNSGDGTNSRLYFRADRSGTYYVVVGGAGTSTGTYRLSIKIYDRDDYGADAGTAGSAMVNEPISGFISDSNDLDWFTVDLKMGKTYRIDLEGDSTRAGTLYRPILYGPLVSIPDTRVAASDVGGGIGTNCRTFYTPSADGTFYLAVGTGVSKAYGTYQLTVTDISTYLAADVTSDKDTTATVTVGESVTGMIDVAFDTDWFGVNLVKGKLYQIDLEGNHTGKGTLEDPYIRGIYDGEEVFIPRTDNDHGGEYTNSRVWFSPKKTAKYYVAAEGNHGLTGTYELTVTDVSADITDEHLDDTDTTGTVVVGGSVEVSIDYPRDNDWFAVDLMAKKVYIIKARYGQIGTDEKPIIQGIIQGIYRKDNDKKHLAPVEMTGAYVADGETVSFLILVAEKSVKHYVAAGAFLHYTGFYDLSVDKINDDYADYAADADDDPTVGVVTVGGSSTGAIHYPYETDWFKVELAKGKYRIDLKGAELGDPKISGVFDADSVKIDGTSDDDSGHYANSWLYFTATEAATYYIAVTSHRHEVKLINYPGSYTLSVTEVADD